jgi:holliday junction resolvase Hjr
MGKKSKGTRAERELFHKFWNSNWACLRTAGSGSTTLPAPDLLVSNSKRVLAIECKSGKTRHKYLQNLEIEELKKFSSLFGAEPWIGARFDAKGWFFIKVSELKRSGKHYVVSLKDAIERGKSFEELIK